MPHDLPEDLEEAILELKRERNAVLLAHYYQESEIQDLADFVGDSLALAQAAAKVERDVIAFCGVHFMAETAKILNPERTVVIPDLGAGCSDLTLIDHGKVRFRGSPAELVARARGKVIEMEVPSGRSSFGAARFSPRVTTRFCAPEIRHGTRRCAPFRARHARRAPRIFGAA